MYKILEYLKWMKCAAQLCVESAVNQKKKKTIRILYIFCTKKEWKKEKEKNVKEEGEEEEECA